MLLPWQVALCLVHLASGSKWWEHEVVYQIYPRSFQDSDGDGIGDLKGIESRLGYFTDLGIKTLWLSPIFQSPMKDFGYDISDFRSIDPIFGTMDTFKSLLTSAKEKSMKIILDFVPNHSSDEHEWFLKSVEKQEPFTDYYVWQDPKGFDAEGHPIPPNNWLSNFRGSAWTFNEKRQQFYLHQFAVGQPDLNYRNPEVIEEMKQVLKFWLDLGVDGFRMDAVGFLVEDDQFRDEPRSFISSDPETYTYLFHIYTYTLAETRSVLGQFYDFIQTYGDRLCMLEVYLPPNMDVAYHKVSDFPFNVGLVMMGKRLTSALFIDLVIETWMYFLPEGKTPNWVLGNHDYWRIGSRTRPSLRNAFNLMLLTLPGVAITYQGEEIGMLNGNVSFEQTVDPAGINCGPEHYADFGCSRDFERTPFHWTANGKNAGFSEANKTWLPISDDFITLNVESETQDPSSHLNFYKKVLSIRNSKEVFSKGALKPIIRGNVLAFSRSVGTKDVIYITVINFSEKEVTVDLTGKFASVVANALVVISTLGNSSHYHPDDVVDLGSLKLGADEGLLLYLYDI